MIGETNTNPDRAAALGLVLRRSVFTAIALGLIGAYPTYAITGPAGLNVLPVAIAIALLGSLLGSLATLRFPVHQPTDVVSAVMLGLGVRFGVTLLPTAALVLGGAATGAAFVLWVGVSKMTLLMIDTFGLLAALRPTAAGAGAGR